MEKDRSSQSAGPMRRSGDPKAIRAQARWFGTFILVCFQESKYFERQMGEAWKGKEVVLFPTR